MRGEHPGEERHKRTPAEDPLSNVHAQEQRSSSPSREDQAPSTPSPNALTAWRGSLVEHKPYLPWCPARPRTVCCGSLLDLVSVHSKCE
jgi:hypothetical protein